VHLRLAHEVRPLESLTSELVEKVDREVAEHRPKPRKTFEAWNVLFLRLCR